MKKTLLIICFLFLNLSFLFSQQLEIKDGIYYKDKKVYTGNYKENYANGNLKMDVNILNGINNGISTYYYENGNKKEQQSFSKGEKDGIWITWNENGVKTAEANFSKGKKKWNVVNLG